VTLESKKSNNPWKSDSPTTQRDRNISLGLTRLIGLRDGRKMLCCKTTQWDISLIIVKYRQTKVMNKQIMKPTCNPTCHCNDSFHLTAHVFIIIYNNNNTNKKKRILRRRQRFATWRFLRTKLSSTKPSCSSEVGSYPPYKN